MNTTAAHDPLTATFAALADPTRRAILARLTRGEATVNDLASPFPISKQAVSQHLKVLRESRLVRAEPKGASNIYHIDPAGLSQMRAWLDRFWSSTLAAYKVAVEKSVEDQQ